MEPTDTPVPAEAARPDAANDPSPTRMALLGRLTGRAAGVAGRGSVRGAKAVGRHVNTLFTQDGKGFRDLALTHAAGTAGDTLVALALAGTLFFSVPSTEARGNVALYLLLTVAPFAVIGPGLGALLDRYPTAYRTTLMSASLARAAAAVALTVAIDTLWLFPLAFVLLVASRTHGISRNALMPVALGTDTELVAANGRLAWIGVLGGTAAAAVGGLAIWIFDPPGPLWLAVVAFVASTWAAMLVPNPDGRQHDGGPRARFRPPRPLRVAQLATAAVRVLNGFLVLLLAFAFRDRDAGIVDFGAVLFAAGLGFALASLASPRLARNVREEPMVVAGLAVEAGAAFVAATWFGLPAAMVLACAAGFAWGTAKLGFDGLMQRTVPEVNRGQAFTRSETLFQLAWVLGAVVPTVAPTPTTIGLVAAGLSALAAQVLFVANLFTRTASGEVPDAARLEQLDK